MVVKLLARAEMSIYLFTTNLFDFSEIYMDHNLHYGKNRAPQKILTTTKELSVNISATLLQPGIGFNVLFVPATGTVSYVSLNKVVLPISIVILEFSPR